MCRRCIRGLLLVMGSAMVLFAVIPFMAFIHLGEPLQTELIASKLLLLPVGAICLAGAATLGTHHLRH
jgi:hypothetical protein